jgi:7-carboxy-7-deazaguanine synthase
MRITKPVNKEVDQIMIRTLKVNEIFYSIQGETSCSGLPTVFIRLTGCPLRCNYCDTAYAFYEGGKISIEEILRKTASYRTRFVTVTGGEPLAQKNCLDLLRLLCDEGYQVSLETSGAIDLADVDSRVCKIVDIKTPGSGEEAKNHWDNLQNITPADQIKFVICNSEDYEWAKLKLNEYRLHERCLEILFSPSHDQLGATLLAEWILKDQLSVRLQVQLHKYLWGNIPGK